MNPEVALADAIETIRELKGIFKDLNRPFPSELNKFCDPKNKNKDAAAVLQIISKLLAEYEKKTQDMKTAIESHKVKGKPVQIYIDSAPHHPDMQVQAKIEEMRFIYWRDCSPIVDKLKEIIEYLEVVKG